MRITATYRIQLHAGFGFADAQRIVDYLDDLGISHAYASPYLAAEPGSTHGYDLVDPRRLNPEIGTVEQYAGWTDALASRSMGHVVDFVPNHMAASTHNAWWSDVLENGPSSTYADHFDIEWHPPKDALEDKVLLPILGGPYGDLLESGALVLERRGGAFFVRYGDRLLPVSPPSAAPVLQRALALLALSEDDPRRQELESMTTALRRMPASRETDVERRSERAREKEVQKRRLATLCDDPLITAAVDEAVALTNGRPGDPASFDDLDTLLLEQCYRLAFWRVATEEINYRRFFDVDALAAIRMESGAVFDDVHALLFEQIARGRIDGVRLDHIDGLYDPADYFEKLRQATAPREVWLIAEKILAPGEEVPNGWAIDGTTGYDFLEACSGLFVDERAESSFTRLYQQTTGDLRSFEDHTREAKRAIMRSSLSSEVHMLVVRLERIAMRDRRSRDFTYAALRRAVTETIVAFPVYRTYVRPTGSSRPLDEQIVGRAIRLASRRNPETSPSVFELLRDVLLLKRDPFDDDDRARRVEVAMRFQQLTGPVCAKGVEDTAFYAYVRFAMLNEVGGRPDRFGTTLEQFHAGNVERRRSSPRTMTASTTHDTKRGEDIRARLAVLTEMPERWATWIGEWCRIAEDHGAMVDDERAPSPADQYLFFQTALGAYSASGEVDGSFAERLVEYAIKAARESKQRTSWLSPNDAYEAALRAFVLGILGDDRFARSLAECSAEIAPHGASNGLAQVILKIASPGVPDTYQGSELWDQRLVDPDNRGPVDFELRRALRQSLEGRRPHDLLGTFGDGRIKLHVVRAALRLRRERADVFLDGDYAPIDAGDAIVAFARRHPTGIAVCAVARRPYFVTRGRVPFAIGDVWGDRIVAAPSGRYRDVLTGRDLEIGSEGARAASLFADLPVSLLIGR